MRRRIVFVVGLLVLGALAAGSAYLATVSWQTISRETAPATATVVEEGTCAGRNDGQRSRAVFRVDGVEYVARVSCSAKPGDRVAILYDPADPTHSIPHHPEGPTPYGSAAWGYGFAAACVALMAVMIWRRARRSSVGGNTEPRAP